MTSTIARAPRRAILETLGADERRGRPPTSGTRANSPSRERVRQPTGKVEPGRVELALVPSPRNEVEDASAARARPRGPPARSTSASPRRLRLYVSGPESPTQATTKPGRDPRMAVLVPREPRDRTDRPGDEEEAVGQSSRDRGQRRGELGEQRDAGEVVVRERRVAHVRREEDLRPLSLPAGQHSPYVSEPGSRCCR